MKEGKGGGGGGGGGGKVATLCRHHVTTFATLPLAPMTHGASSNARCVSHGLASH